MPKLNAPAEIHWRRSNMNTRDPILMKSVEVLKDCRSLNAAAEMNCPMPRSLEKVPIRNEKRCINGRYLPSKPDVELEAADQFCFCFARTCNMHVYNRVPHGHKLCRCLKPFSRYDHVPKSTAGPLCYLPSAGRPPERLVW